MLLHLKQRALIINSFLGISWNVKLMLLIASLILDDRFVCQAVFVMISTCEWAICKFLSISKCHNFKITGLGSSLRLFSGYIIWASSWGNRIFAYAKTKTQISFAVTAKLISAFAFTTRIVQSLNFLFPKFQASSHLLWLYSPVCVGSGWKPWRPVFSERGSNYSQDIVWRLYVSVFRGSYLSGHLKRNFLKCQSHIHDFGPGRATVHPDLSNRGASAWFVVAP